MFALLLAQEAATSRDWFPKFEAGELTFMLMIGLGCLIGLVAVIGYYWHEFRQAEYTAGLKQAELDAAAKKMELEAGLKREMIARGMSADDIERVLRTQLSATLPSSSSGVPAKPAK